MHAAEISRRLAPLGFEITQLACGLPGAKPAAALEGMTLRRLGNLAGYSLRGAAGADGSFRKQRLPASPCA